MKADLYPIFGGYQGYMEAPWDEVQRQQLVWIGRKNIEAQQNADFEAKMDAQQREASRR